MAMRLPQEGGVMSQTGSAGERGTLIVVRAGAAERFAALEAAFGGDGVGVVWDRRAGERRRDGRDAPGAAERRRRDRRGPVPASWALLDFLVVPAAPAAT
jgi:hypothetical protein